MKILMTLALLISGTNIAIAETNWRKFTTELNSIKKQEQEQNYLGAFSHSLSLANQLSNNLGVDKVVASTESSLHSIENEVVTSSTSNGLKFNLLGLIKFKGKRTQHKTSWILSNPDEVAQFPTKVERDLESLKSDLNSYIRDNAKSIVYLKTLTAKTIQLAAKLSNENRLRYSGYVDRLYTQSQFLTFIGVQTILSCTTRNHAGYTDDLSVGLSGLLLSLKFKNTTNHNSYTATTCSAHERSEITTTGGNDLMNLDSLIDVLYQDFSVALLRDSHAPLFPTFGNPYY